MIAHLSHNMHENSLKAHAEIADLISGRRGEVYRWIEAHGAATDREVMAGLGYRDMNACRPRLSELISDGLLVEVGARRCPVTGKTVRVVGIPKREGQMRLVL